ncbi:helix-turn-helix transcriptional regulator [Paenibacillus flagellatus]|uniref:ArsR family transcriptional regulator n=1 Tax=Paenibacillus flagellatus TaxID=2211139 RepID=A0A2V5KB65_9BACL|nr:metalloregulator ArsR/SmtB family transcription factor [Paenibacillus flagellatus]PYI56142.1 ArsR family transcriptional regulator [Paenibacillus flagellatus]
MNMEQDSSTRKTILTMLKTGGPLGVGEMAKRLGITEMAVRRHLNTLERDGYVGSQIVRQSMGRPMHVYRLTEAADDLFPKNYHTLTLDLLGELADDEDGVGKLFDKRKEKLLRKYEPEMEGKPLEERVEKLADIQNANGYMVEWEKTGRGFAITEYNCPISQVANRYNEACECEQRLFEGLLGTKVERTECLAKGDGKCVYHIQTKPR